MKFTEFTISTTSEASELIADILWQYTTYGVAVCDYKDVIELIEYRRDTFDYMEEELENATSSGALVKAYVEIEESNKVALFRIPSIQDFGLSYFKEELVTQDSELILVRKPLTFKDILLSNYDYQFISDKSRKHNKN